MIQGRYTPGMDKLTAWEEIVSKISMAFEGESLEGGGSPEEHTYQLKNMYYCAPLYVGEE